MKKAISSAHFLTHDQLMGRKMLLELSQMGFNKIKKLGRKIAKENATKRLED